MQEDAEQVDIAKKITKLYNRITTWVIERKCQYDSNLETKRGHLWVCYLLQEELARYGLYTLFDYGAHELASVISLISLLATVVALVVLVCQVVRKTGETSNPWFILLLGLLLVAQLSYFYDASQVVSVTTVVKVVAVDEEHGTITVVNAFEEEAAPVVLDAPELILNLVQEGDAQYSVMYESHSGHPDQGKLVSMSLSGAPHS